MNKLNKKGFTLIELLAVLVILSIIMTIALPNITSSVERSKDKQKKLTEDLVVSAVEVYADTHKNTIDTLLNASDGCETNGINITKLIDNNILTKEEAKDPTNEKYTLCGCVMYDSSNNSYSWTDKDNQSDSNDYRYEIN